MASTYQVFQPASQAPFEQRSYGAAWGGAFGTVKDQLMAAMKLGVMARMPNLAPLDALGEIGTERGIFQGEIETTAHYIPRVINAWGAWTIGGTYWGLLAQLYGSGYTSAYIVAANGYIYGPSSGVVAPDPINDVAGTPPTFTQIPYYITHGSAPTSSEWAATTAYGLNALVTPTAQPGTYFIAVVEGTSGNSQPTWPGAGGTVIDGSVTWAYAGTYSPLDVNPPWVFGAGNGQGESGNVAINQPSDAGGSPNASGSFWSRFLVMFDPVPSGWTDIVNPPTNATAPTSGEVTLIQTIIEKFKPGKSACVGILALSGTRACYGWPFTTTTNIAFSCWLSRAIATGDSPASTAFVNTAQQTVNSWAPNTAVANVGGSTFIFMVPSSYRQNGYFYTSPSSSGATGFSEPTWPTTIGNTVTDNGMTWTCRGTLSAFSANTSATCFKAFEEV